MALLYRKKSKGRSLLEEAEPDIDVTALNAKVIRNYQKNKVKINNFFII